MENKMNNKTPFMTQLQVSILLFGLFVGYVAGYWTACYHITKYTEHEIQYRVYDKLSEIAC